MYSGAIMRTIVQKMFTIHNERAPVRLLLGQMVRFQASRKRKRERESEREREREREIFVFTYFRVETINETLDPSKRLSGFEKQV